ncbi:MAG: WD40 repeat domain-containing protein [Cytophagales bacterium]|nr:WD40 repeat domain-containing protein [Cytophagales bacterium]
MANIQLQKSHTFTGHTSGIFCLQAVDEYHFLSAGGDGQVVSWDLKNLFDGQIIAKLDSIIYGLLTDGDKVLIGESSRALHLLDMTNNIVLRSVEIKSPIFAIHRIGDQYLIGTGAGELLCFDLELNLKKKIRLSEKSLRTISSYQGDIALGYSDNIIRILNEDFELKIELTEPTLSVFSTQFHPESGVLIATGRDAHIRAWDRFIHFKLIHDVSAHTFATNHLVFSPDSKYFASGSMDKTIKIWDATTFELVKVIDKARHDGHTNSVNNLLWMKYDNLLVTCSDDRTIAVWDMNFDEK